ncbi:Heterogeneous nuclear ribonucleoprotein 1 [Spatholobus suberectus]|nr:Heterogeneous nuclear ribonucleoprotein 1 [Spatholobus suberectus]
MESPSNHHAVDGDANDVRPFSHRDDDDDKPQPLTGDGASPGKIFIGGLARETTIAQFIKHFGKYGEITDSVIMKDRKTGQPRGFGFITYADPSVVDGVIEDTHIINGKQVEIKRTIPRGAVGSNSKDFRTKKIFVGGIPSTVTEDEFRDFFTRYGEVKDHQIMRDHSTNRSRGFGFITYDSEEAVDDLLAVGTKLSLLELRWKSRRQNQRSQIHQLHHPSAIMTLGLHMVVDMEMLMTDLVVILVWVTIGQVVPMVVGEVLMVALEVNLVGMEDMLVPWGLIEVILHLGMLVDMVEALAEAMILVGMVDPLRVMGHMVVVVPLVVPMEAAMMPA